MSSVRLAATVILVRPPFEVYLARRSASSAFAPDAFVFPGGTLAAQDSSQEARARTIGLEADRIDREFRAAIPENLASDEPPVDRESARALLVAALRELFEEAGVLFVRTAGGGAIEATPAVWERVAEQRVEVRDDRLAFADFLADHDWYADARALALFSHWITPRSEPRRYNTHFFFAAAPADQAAVADAFETHDGIWISPAAALERFGAGTLHLVYPTIKHLARLASFDSVDAAWEFARAKPVVTIVPADAGNDFAIPPALEDAW